MKSLVGYAAGAKSLNSLAAIEFGRVLNYEIAEFGRFDRVGLGARPGLPQSFIRVEEEGPVLDDRSTDRVAELVFSNDWHFGLKYVA